MIEMHKELESKIEKYGGNNLFNLIGEIVTAYEKGEINNWEYVHLYEFLKLKSEK